MENIRSNIAGIQRDTKPLLPNSWISKNSSRTSGTKDLSIPGNRKLANAHPPTTYHPQSPSGAAIRHVRCDGPIHIRIIYDHFTIIVTYWFSILCYNVYRWYLSYINIDGQYNIAIIYQMHLK